MNKIVFAWGLVACLLSVLFAWGAAQSEYAYTSDQGRHFFVRR